MPSQAEIIFPCTSPKQVVNHHSSAKEIHIHNSPSVWHFCWKSRTCLSQFSSSYCLWLLLQWFSETEKTVLRRIQMSSYHGYFIPISLTSFTDALTFFLRSSIMYRSSVYSYGHALNISLHCDGLSKDFPTSNAVSRISRVSVTYLNPINS